MLKILTMGLASWVPTAAVSYVLKCLCYRWIVPVVCPLQAQCNVRSQDTLTVAANEGISIKRNSPPWFSVDVHCSLGARRTASFVFCCTMCTWQRSNTTAHKPPGNELPGRSPTKLLTCVFAISLPAYKLSLTRTTTTAAICSGSRCERSVNKTQRHTPNVVHYLV